MARVDISTRLRQAIRLNDISLVQRLLRNNPDYLYNPDFEDKSNTSLHLAARNGFAEVVEYLISLGHDGNTPAMDQVYQNEAGNTGISMNTDGQCPLHLAATHSRTKAVEILCQQFPETINRSDSGGRTALHLASSAHIASNSNAATLSSSRAMHKGPDDISTIETLLMMGANVHAQDNEGNTCLHNATAWGNLKAVRAFIQAGADPLCSNHAGWTPQYYSFTVQAEVYYRNLIAEFEKRKAEESLRVHEQRVKGGGGVRLVSEGDESDGTESDHGRSRASSGKSLVSSDSEAGLGINVGHVDAWK